MTTKYQQEGGSSPTPTAARPSRPAMWSMGHTIGIALTDIAATTGSGAVAVEGVLRAS